MQKNTRNTIKYYFTHIKRFKGLTLVIFVLLTISSVTDMLWAVVLRQFFNTLAEPGSRDVLAASLLATLGQLFAVSMGNLISNRGFVYGIVLLQTRIIKNILDDCFEYLHGHSYRFFTQNFSGALVKRVNRMADAFESLSDKVFFEFYPMILKLIITVVVLFYLNLTLGLIMLSWSISFFVVNYFLSLYRLRFDLANAEADTAVTARLSDTIINNTNIKLFSGQAEETKHFKETTSVRRTRLHTSWMIDVKIDTLQMVLMVVLQIAILYVAIDLWKKNILQVGDFFLIQTYLFDTFQQLWRLGRNIRDFYRHLANADEMTAILLTPHEVLDRPNAKPIRISSGKVEFDRVTFCYDDKNEEPVIKQLSFKITPGEKVALIGPSGGGKSTVIKLLLRLFDIQNGTILIDNQDISQVTQDSLRSQIALVPQDPILFHRTLLENIRYSRPDATDQEVIAASKMAYCHDFISKFPLGYSTFVGERGVKLSGGQRQRVAIARAILSNAKILILDEATSSLDSESETYIQKALKNLMRHKTTFIIAHRLSTVMEADTIFVLQDGQIIEQGRHSDLTNKKGSLYSKLWNIQVGGFLGEEEKDDRGQPEED